MSQANVEIVRRLWQAWERGDLNGMLDTLSEHVVTRAHNAMEGTTEYQGKEGYLELVTRFTSSFDDYSATAEEFIETGDHVVVRNRQTGRGETSGASTEAVYWFVYQVAEGKIVRQDYYPTEHEALEAAGLSE